MTLIQWDNRLAFNIAEIDSQHQKLVAMINDLNSAMQQGKGRDAIQRILDGLMSYTEYHFDAEEKLLGRHEYAELPNHQTEHLAFVQKVADFKAKYDQGKLVLSIDLMTFLSDWLKGHIMGIDRKYVPHLAAKGVK